MKAEEHHMISLKCEKKQRFFPEYPRYFVFNENNKKAPFASEGGGGAIEFSAELMVNRATCKIVECICFVPLKYGQNKVNIAPHRFFDSHMEIHRIKLPMHPSDQCKKSRGMPEDAKHSIYLNILACQCIHLCLANPNSRFS